MRILVTFAVDWEFKAWMRLRSFQAVPGDDRVFRTQIAGEDVCVLLTGVGPGNAARSVRTRLDEAPDFCIASGLTGGLKHEHRPGEILVARAACPETAGEVLESDERLFGAAVESGAKGVDLFVSTEHVVRTAKRKSEFHPNADAVDMESFTIMKEMASLSVPCVALRSVADPAGMDVPCDFDRALDASGRIRMMQVIGQVACNPRQAWPLLRFGTQSSRAASALARYLDGYIANLARHEERLESSLQQINQ